MNNEHNKKISKALWLILAIVVVFFFMSAGLLKITGFNLFGIDFGFNKEDNKQDDGPVIVQSSIKDLEIREFYPEIEIFSKNSSNATVRFIIDNWLKCPYNITVEFFYEDKYVGKWFNISTESYDINKVENSYYSYQPIFDNIGNWKTQLIVDYSFNGVKSKKSKT